MIRPYSSYKDSGIEWIGEIPSDWEIKPLKYCFSFQVGWTPPTGESENFIGDNKWATIADLRQKTIYETEKNISNDAVSRSRIKINPGGTLFYSFKLSVGKVAFAGCEMYTNEAIFSILPNNRDVLEYYYYLLPVVLSSYGRENIYGANLLNQELIKNASIIFPTKSMQEVIAGYLDLKTAQIDDLITKKEQMIEFLKEERTAIINQAVTKGLDSKVEMKDSGIEWLGKVPKHWGIKKLKYIANVETGITPPSNETAYYDNGDIDWFTPGDFNDSIFLNDSNRKINHKAVQEGVAKVYKPFAVLMIGIGATLGKIGIIDKSASSNQQINAISFSNNFNPFYGAFYFKAIAISIISLSNASTLAILNQSQTKDILLTVPPLDEQNGIAEFIKLVNIRTDNLILKEQTQIDLLKEYRTALISEVVTGKTDVRN